MLHTTSRFTRKHIFPVAVALLLARLAVAGDNEILGEIKLVHSGGIERLAGVWIDGQYLGYLKELKGSKKILLVPGLHQIVVRHVGYQPLIHEITVEPGQTKALQVTLLPDARPTVSTASSAEVRTLVRPNRAAVFVDQVFAGHADEFDGPGQAMIVPAGKHAIRVALPGYRDFATEIDLLPGQKFELKTELLKGSIRQAGSLITEKNK